MRRKLFILSGIALLFGLSFVWAVNVFTLKEINKNEIDVNQFIKCSDEVSSSKAQVNWQYVASIIGIQNKNNFKDVSNDEIKNIANLFIIKDGEKYKISNLDDVLKKLEFSSKEVKRTHDYVSDLKYFGLKPSRLNPDGKYMTFIDSVKNSAIYNYNKYKILPSITIAQSILESNWGKSELSSKYNNLFGIKANNAWKGEYVNIETSEFYDQVITDKFRVYKTKSESIQDHAKFLSENPRYKEVLTKATYIEQAEELQNAGYSTVSDESGNLTYKNLLIEIIQQYNLQLIDSYVQEIRG